jgi:aminoglycoside phosphotransferase (APT) family kinase protein
MEPLEIAARFRLAGAPCSACPHGHGHINDTWRIQTGADRQYILQRINPRVFPEPLAVMHNVEIVTRHLEQHSHAAATLALIETRDDRRFVVDDADMVWRMYRYVAQTYSVNTVSIGTQAYEAGRMFGLFLQDMSSLEPSLLKTTLPGFHSLRSRLDGLEQATQRADRVRLLGVAGELDFVAARRSWADVVAPGPGSHKLPERITHNDCKLNNVLFHEGTHSAVCVVDLDTVMPGLALYDFGDLVRSTSAMSAEDEVNRAKVGFNLEHFQATAAGYLGVAGNNLTPIERHLLPFSCRYIAFMLGVRFLTDYLAGDTYFKTHRPNQNLDRARVQFRMTELMEDQQSKMEAIVAQLTKQTDA